MVGGVTVMPPVSGEWPPDPVADPQFYRDVTLRRVLAFFIDFMIIAMITLVIHMAFGMLSIMTLGLAAPLHGLVIALSPLFGLLYHVLQVGSPISATLGMRLVGLRAWSVMGGRPSGLQALFHGVCYYGSMAITGGLICLVALFTRRRQTLHDLLAGIVVLRDI